LAARRLTGPLRRFYRRKQRSTTAECDEAAWRAARLSWQGYECRVLALLVSRRELAIARRVLAVALLIGGFAIVATPTRASGADRVRVLVPSTRYTASPSLAVNAGGASLVSWFGGPAPIVSMEPLRGHHHYYVGEKLFAAVGPSATVWLAGLACRARE